MNWIATAAQQRAKAIIDLHVSQGDTKIKFATAETNPL
jgi:hypothetical protein